MVINCTCADGKKVSSPRPVRAKDRQNYMHIPFVWSFLPLSFHECFSLRQQSSALHHTSPLVEDKSVHTIHNIGAYVAKSSRTKLSYTKCLICSNYIKACIKISCFRALEIHYIMPKGGESDLNIYILSFKHKISILCNSIIRTLIIIMAIAG